MTWIGRKKLAFIPLHRPNAHPPDEPIPTDWPNQILQRVLFDPDPKTGADRSLRAISTPCRPDWLTSTRS
jgi:hypothetical protein